MCKDPERTRNHPAGSDPASCHECAVVASEELMRSPEFLAWDLGQIEGEIDMAGPEEPKATDLQWIPVVKR